MISYVAHKNFTKATSYLVWPLEIIYVLKLLVFLYYEKDILEIEDMLENPLLSTYSQDYTFVKKNMDFIDKFAKVSFILIIFDESFYMFLEPSVSEKRHLPNEVDAPCDMNNNLCYVVSYIIEVYMIYIYGVFMMLIDCIYCKWTMICSCLFEILYNNLKNIDYENDKRALALLKENVSRHIAILRWVY